MNADTYYCKDCETEHHHLDLCNKAILLNKSKLEMINEYRKILTETIATLNYLDNQEVIVDGDCFTTYSLAARIDDLLLKEFYRYDKE